ncbi:universal stress protein [Roseivirga sp.]|uniref:universal stress protein n=1 Tax=Roseivirga sp. TaxID=1964215 RepID=UPI003B52DB80
MKPQNILVPVDFSNCSRQALRVAIELAKTFDSGLVIMNACENPQGFGDISEATMAEEFVKSLEARSRKSYEEMKASLPQLSEVEHEFVIQHAFVKAAVLEMLLVNEFDLIVIGTTGASGLKKVFMGSNAYDIIKHADIPVLAIPEEAHVHKVMHRMVLACDYDRTYSKSTFHMLIELASTWNAQVQLLHVSQSAVTEPAKMTESTKLEHYFKGLEHSSHMVVDVNLDEAIQDFVTEHQADLLALVFKKHSWLDRFFRGNLTKRMAFHSKIPLLILKARKS